MKGTKANNANGERYSKIQSVSNWDLEDAKGEVDFLCGVLDSMSYVKRQRREQKIIGLQLVTRKFIEHISKDLGVT